MLWLFLWNEILLWLYSSLIKGYVIRVSANSHTKRYYFSSFRVECVKVYPTVHKMYRFNASTEKRSRRNGAGSMSPNSPARLKDTCGILSRSTKSLRNKNLDCWSCPSATGSLNSRRLVRRVNSKSEMNHDRGLTCCDWQRVAKSSLEYERFQVPITILSYVQYFFYTTRYLE